MSNFKFSDSFFFKTGERIIPGSVSNYCLAIHYSRYLFSQRFCKGKKVLNVASGSGYGSEVLLSNSKEVYNVDISPELVFYGVQEFGAYNNHFLLMDAQKMSFPDEFFDVIVSFETLEHIPNSDLFLKECNRVLKKDGKMILSTPNKIVNSPDTIKPYNSFHYEELDIKGWKSKICKHFKIIEQHGLEKSTPVRMNMKNKLISSFVQLCIDITPGLIIKFIKKHILKYKKVKLQDISLNKDQIVSKCKDAEFYLDKNNKAYKYMIFVLGKK